MTLKRVLFVLGFLLALTAVTWSDSGMMSVQVKEGQLRSTPSFLGTLVGPVSYGERVEVVQKQGDWFDVKSSKNLAGWIHQSALTSKQLVLNAGGQARTAASDKEVALAGKGFNADVEAQYRRNNGMADYASVDRMESISISEDQMISFLDEGKLRPSEGGLR